MHQKLIFPPLTRATRAVWIGALVLLVAAVLLGGATSAGFMPNAIVRVISLAVLLLTIWRSPPMWAAPARWPLLLLLAIVAVPLLQLIPLPPSVWSTLPGRAGFVADYQAAGMALPWLPVSLAAHATWNAALALLPAAAMFVATLGMDTGQRRALLPWILGLAGLSVLLGLGQVADGPESGLRFYEITNVSEAVGFFANRNHQASFLVSVVPLAAFWALGWAQRGGGRRTLLTVLGAGLAVVFAAGVGVSESRAGVLLLAVAGVGCLLMVIRAGKFTPSRRTVFIALGLVVLGLVPALGFGLGDIIRGIPASMATDPRLLALPTVAQAGAANLPFGTGLGTFEAIYRMLETPQTLTNAYLNHAHNDYLELFLETGIVGPVLVVLFLVWFAMASVRAWRAPAVSQTAGLARAASLSILLLVTHSLVDYPLRTAAISTLFAFLCACLVVPVQPAERRVRVGPATAEPSP